MKKVFLFSEVVILSVLFLICLRAPTNVFTCGNDSFTKNAETGYYDSSDFELRPGVYRVCVLAEGEEGVGSGIDIGLDAGVSVYRSLRGNRGKMYSGAQYKEVIYYVTTTIPAACVTLQPFSEEVPMSYSVQVDRTTAGNRILFVIVAAVFLLMDILWILRERIAVKQEAEKKWTSASIVAIILLVSIPLTATWLIPGEKVLQCLQETEYVRRGSIGQVPFWHLCYLWLPAIMRRIGFPVMTAYKGLQFGLILFAVLVFYEVLARTWKEERWVLPGVMLGVGNPAALALLYEKNQYVLFLLYVIVGAGLLAISGLWITKKKISSWFIFAVVAVVFLQAVYFQNRLTFQSEPLYWYNEEPFMTGGGQV